MNYYQVKPEVPGEFGQDTQIDHSTVPFTDTKLTFVFTNWLGDDLITSTPCFMVTGQLAKALKYAKLSGFTCTPIAVSIEQDYKDMMPKNPLKADWQWLRLNGIPFVNDVAIDQHLHLIVSEQALMVMKRFTLKEAVISEVTKI